MEGRVHAQNDEFGHSRVDTHIPPWSAHMHALKHAHTHTHIQKSSNKCSNVLITGQEKPVRANSAGMIILSAL